MTNGYRLESLLSLRRREEEAAQRGLAAALVALKTAEAGVSAASSHEAHCRELLGEALAARVEPSARRASRQEALERFASRRREEAARAAAALTQARAAQAAAEGEVGRARERLSERLREREAVERHRGRWEAAQRRAADRREEQALDEHGGRRGPTHGGGAP